MIYIKSILSIINDLESIGDIYYSLSKLLERKSKNKIYFVPNQRNNILDMINKVEDLFSFLKNYIENTNEKSSKIIKTEKNNFKKFHYNLKKDHLINISKSKYSIKSGVIYSDILSGLDEVTSHIVEVKNSID